MVHKDILQHYLAHVCVEMLYGRYCTCSESWKDIDYVPSYSKLYYIIDGEGLLRFCGKDYYPRPGELYLMPAGIKASYSTISNHRFTKYFCHFTANVSNINLFNLINMPPFVRVREPEVVISLFEKLFAATETTGLAAILRVRSALLELLSIFIEYAGEQNMSLVNAVIVEKLNPIIDYIHDHLSEKILIRNIAEMVNMHPTSFCKLFRKHLLLSPKRYIIMKRMESARDLLLATSLSLSEIADINGYNDAFHLSKSFKNYYGLSPSDYRKEIGHESRRPVSPNNPDL